MGIQTNKIVLLLFAFALFMAAAQTRRANDLDTENSKKDESIGIIVLIVLAAVVYLIVTYPIMLLALFGFALFMTAAQTRSADNLETENPKKDESIGIVGVLVLAAAAYLLITYGPLLANPIMLIAVCCLIALLIAMQFHKPVSLTEIIIENILLPVSCMQHFVCVVFCSVFFFCCCALRQNYFLSSIISALAVVLYLVSSNSGKNVQV